MGTLKQDTTYIYERADGVTYAREFGATERTAIGWDYPPAAHGINWVDVLETAHTHPALQRALDHAILVYKLSKEKLNG